MLSTSFLKGAGAVAAIALTLTAAAAPQAAYAREHHHGGAGIALGVIGGILAGAAIASGQAAYAAPLAYDDQPYDAPPYYGSTTGHYGPSPYGWYR